MDELTVRGLVAPKLEVWNQRLLACKSSGLTVPEWCRRNEVNIKTYYYWHHKIHEMVKSQESEITSGFYEVPESADTETKYHDGVRINIGAYSVDVPETANEETLVKVLRAIQKC